MDGVYSNTPPASRTHGHPSLPRILYSVLNVVAFTPILGLPAITAIAYLNPDYARASDIGLLGFVLGSLFIVTAISLPINLGGAIYFGIRRRDRTLSLALSLCVTVPVLALLIYNTISF